MMPLAVCHAHGATLTSATEAVVNAESDAALKQRNANARQKARIRLQPEMSQGILVTAEGPQDMPFVP